MTLCSQQFLCVYFCVQTNLFIYQSILPISMSYCLHSLGAHTTSNCQGHVTPIEVEHILPPPIRAIWAVSGLFGEALCCRLQFNQPNFPKSTLEQTYSYVKHIYLLFENMGELSSFLTYSLSFYTDEIFNKVSQIIRHILHYCINFTFCCTFNFNAVNPFHCDL